MATKRASAGTKSNKKKAPALKRETERITSQTRAPKSPKVPTDEKVRSQGRYPGSTPTADDELARKAHVRPARGSRTPPLTTRKRAERPRPD